MQGSNNSGMGGQSNTLGLYKPDNTSRQRWLANMNRSLQAASTAEKKLQPLPQDFPYPNEQSYSQRLGAWLISNGLSPYQNPPECLPQAYPNVPPYISSANVNSVRGVMSSSSSPPYSTAATFNAVIAVLNDHALQLVRFSDQEKVLKKFDVLLSEKSHALEVGLQANNRLVTNVTAKVVEQGEKFIRLEAQLAEQSVVCRQLEVKSENQQKTINSLNNKLKKTRVKVKRISGQHLQMQALAGEEKRRREALEQQMLAMNARFQEMENRIQGYQEKQVEMEKQMNDHQVAQSLLEAVNVQTDLKQRRYSLNFPSSRTRNI